MDGIARPTADEISPWQLPHTATTPVGWLIDRMDLMLEWLSAVDDLQALAARLEISDREPL